jgi:peptide/nickel transport system ATP-binding protein
VAPSDAALRWKDIGLSIRGRSILKGITLSVHRGECLALVGESGSGKTLCCMAALGMLPEGGRLTSGSIEGLGQVWSSASDEDLAPIPKGDRIAMVFQEPMTSLDPTMRCGRQLEHVLRRHGNLDRKTAMFRVRGLLEEVRMPDVDRAMSAYPHELSGGQKQRILIAMALSNDPDILLADEPTTALDSTLRAELLSLLRELQRRRGLAMVLVTHDMEVVERHADRVAVLYRGEAVEQGPVAGVLTRPSHPYTRGLLACRVPRSGRPTPLPIMNTFLAGVAEKTTQEEIQSVPDTAPLLLEVRGATKTYPGQKEPAIENVSLVLREGGSLGIVGGSGCGKTTLARAILGLHSLDSGTITLAGREVQEGRPEDLRHIRANAGLVFQDPRAALNPAKRIGTVIEEVLIQWGADRKVAREEAGTLLESVGLDRSALDKRPDAFSGGQRQRIVIARALAARPKLLLCDEAVAALDVSVQAQVLNLLVRLQAERGLALLFISHDLGVVRYLCDHTAVMDCGAVVESADSQSIWSTPGHPVTRRLQAAGGGSID